MHLHGHGTPGNTLKGDTFVKYYDQGWGYKKIAKKFSTSIKRVRDAVYLARDTGRVYSRAKSGRPPSLTPRAQ